MIRKTVTVAITALALAAPAAAQAKTPSVLISATPVQCLGVANAAVTATQVDCDRAVRISKRAVRRGYPLILRDANKRWSLLGVLSAAGRERATYRLGGRRIAVDLDTQVS